MNPSDVVVAREYAEFFRQAAEQAPRTWPEEIEAGRELAYRVMTAVERGWITPTENLSEVIARYLDPCAWNRREARRQAKESHDPYNVWCAVLAGTQLLTENNGKRFWPVKDLRTGTDVCGGFAGDIDPATLRLPSPKRRAKTCTLLAELIEQGIVAHERAERPGDEIETKPSANGPLFEVTGEVTKEQMKFLRWLYVQPEMKAHLGDVAKYRRSLKRDATRNDWPSQYKFCARLRERLTTLCKRVQLDIKDNNVKIIISESSRRTKMSGEMSDLSDAR